MPLVKATLSSALAAAFTKQKAVTSPTDVKVPKITSALADDLGKAYHSYASAALCSGMAASGGDGSKVASALKGADHFDGWEQGLKDYWDGVSFAGAGFIPKNPASGSGISGVKSGVRGLLAGPAGDLAKTAPNEIPAFCDLLAGVLDTGSKKATAMTTTTAVPPVVVAKAPIS
jgi:hypothetical protein